MSIKLDMIGLTCKDVRRSMDFYQAVGLEVPKGPPDGPYVEITLEGGIRLSWNDIEMVKSIDPDWEEPVGQRVGLAFLCDSPEAVDSRYRAVVAAGFDGHKEPWDAFWGQRYAQLRDPDGNIVDLFAPLAE